MNNYLICGIDKNANCIVRAFDTFNEYREAIRYMVNYIDLSSLYGYNTAHDLIYQNEWR